MSADRADVTVENNEAAGRFEAKVEGHLAVAAYEREGNTIIFTHTVVPRALEGQRIGNALARTALDEARTRHLAVIPRCPFIASFIRRHQEYAELVPVEYREQLLRG
jgi:hypothetical protein